MANPQRPTAHAIASRATACKTNPMPAMPSKTDERSRPATTAHRTGSLRKSPARSASRAHSSRSPRNARTAPQPRKLARRTRARLACRKSHDRRTEPAGPPHARRKPTRRRPASQRRPSHARQRLPTRQHDDPRSSAGCPPRPVSPSAHIGYTRRKACAFALIPRIDPSQQAFRLTNPRVTLS